MTSVGRRVPGDPAKTIVRTFELKDRDAVFDLYGRVFGAEALARFAMRWRWQFLDSPAAHLAPLLQWVAETEEGTTVGYLGAFPARLKAMDRLEVIYQDCDLIVAPEARRQGLAERLVRSYDTCPSVMSITIAYAAANGRIRSRLGYRPVSLVPLLVRVRNVAAVLDFYTASRGPGILRAPPVAWTLRGLSHLASVVSRAWNAGRTPALGAVQVAAVDRAGEEFDEVWRRVAPSVAFATVRDRAFVQWRFFDDPLFAHRVFLARDRTGRPAGYAAARVTPRGRLRMGRLIDLFCAPDDPAVAQALLGAAIRWIDQEGADIVTCIGLAPALRRLVRPAFLMAPRRLANPSWLLWKGDAARGAAVYQPVNWHVTYADADIGFTP